MTSQYITIVFDDGETQRAMVAEGQDARYAGDNFFDEPHNEPVTIKLTSSMKGALVKFAQEEGYTSLGPAVRELIMIGLQYYPLEAYRKARDKGAKYRDDPIVKKFFSDAR